MEPLPTIFVSIASYRDPDCQNTVNELFAQARHPERVFIGICWQFVPGEDDDCFAIPPLYPKQVRRLDVHASESQGACWARHQVQTLWQGEDYYFQIDSHMRFVQDWDDKLIKMLASCPSNKPVLSTYPLAFTPPRELSEDRIVTLHPGGFDAQSILNLRSTTALLDQAKEIPEKSAYIAGGLLFASGEIINNVPYDPHLYFEGEEICFAVRLWTSGWDIFTPNSVIAYHDYTKRPDRPRHWKDKINWAALNEKSHQRIQHLLDIKKSTDENVLIEIDRYGLGKIRSLTDYEKFSGLDFKGRMYQGKPLPRVGSEADQPQQVKNRQLIFTSIWEKNFWGCSETRSGHGSTLAATKVLRKELLDAFNFLNIKTLADMGCGDLNWMQELTNKLQFYFGYDIVPGLIEDLRCRFSLHANCFFSVADAVTDALPECDAIIYRDCLTHLPLDAALLALQKFKQSKSRYLIATTHATGKNVCIATGGWYAMDLTVAPFNLPPPQLVINEGVGTKTLGVWSRSVLPE